MNEKMFSRVSAKGKSFLNILTRLYKDIGTHFRIGESGVSHASRRIKNRMRNDKQLKRKIAMIEKH